MNTHGAVRESWGGQAVDSAAKGSNIISGPSGLVCLFFFISPLLSLQVTFLLLPQGTSESGGSVPPTMAFPSATSVFRSIGLLTLLFAAAVHSNTEFGELQFSLSFPYLPGAPDLLPLIC